MNSLNEIENKIISLANRSVKFKIGKTGQDNCTRLAQNKGFACSEILLSSANKKLIDNLEAKMIDKFYDYKNNKNVNRGSAAQMTDKSGIYHLYVMCTLKR